MLKAIGVCFDDGLRANEMNHGKSDSRCLMTLLIMMVKVMQQYAFVTPNYLSRRPHVETGSLE